MESTLLQVDNANKLNVGLQACRAHVVGSLEFDIIKHIHVDIFFQARYVLNEVRIKVRLVRSKDLLPNGDARLKITLVRKVKILPSVFVAHAQAHEQNNSMARYPIKRTVCKAFAIPQHYREIKYEKVVSGSFPHDWSSGW